MMKVVRENNAYVSNVQEIEPFVADAGVVKLRWGVGGEQRGVDWTVTIAPEDFKALAAAMIVADRQAAVKAFEASAAAKRHRVRRSFM